MGGNYGGADCVHVIDLHNPDRGDLPDFVVGLLDDTDVIIHDEHEKFVQFTYQEWDDFVVKMKRGEYEDVGA